MDNKPADLDGNVLGTEQHFLSNPEPQPDALALKKYEILYTVGSGGMGIVYKARQRLLNKIVAIKMLHLHLLTEKVAVSRFQRGARAAITLVHPHLVAIHDFGVTDFGQPFLVMDYVEGKPLSQIIASEGPLSLPRFQQIFAQTVDALQYAHSCGVLHRDVKPSNLMITNLGTDKECVKILDFGIAKSVDTEKSTLTRTGEIVGSPIYMSPEQALGGELDQRSDLYSLGCIMYESLCGVPPFIGKNAMDTMLKHLNDQPQSIKEASLGREIPELLHSLIEKLLAKNPSERFQTTSELHSALEAVFAGNSKPNLDGKAGADNGSNKQKLPMPTQESKPRSNAKLVSFVFVLLFGLLLTLVIGLLVQPLIQKPKTSDSATSPSSLPATHFLPSPQESGSILREVYSKLHNRKYMNRTRQSFRAAELELMLENERRRRDATDVKHPIPDR